MAPLPNAKNCSPSRTTARALQLIALAPIVAACAGAAAHAQLAPQPLPNLPAPASMVSPLLPPVPSPQSPVQKFGSATQGIFSYPTFLGVGASAGFDQAQDFIPEFHQGAAGYARYYWRGFANQAVDGYMSEFVLPVLLHQDPRYYRMGPWGGGVWQRSRYALTRLVVTRSDDGQEEFNTSVIAGMGIAAAISSTWYPQSQLTGSRVVERWGANIGSEGLGFLAKEFLPDVGSAIGNVVTRRHHRDLLPPE